MSSSSFNDSEYEKLKQHIIKPESSPLTDEHKHMLDRILWVARVLDKNPVFKNALSIHQKKYPEIGKSRAWRDVSLAIKLFNTLHEFDFDLWQTWLINNIIENINRIRMQASSSAGSKQIGALLRAISAEHSNLIKLIGNKPESITDPRLTEKHDFYILIQVNNGGTTQEIKIDHSKLKSLPPKALTELNEYLFAGKEITDAEAEEIMNS